MGVRVCLIVPALAEQNEGWSLRAAAAANSRWLEVTGSFFLSPLPLVSHLFSVQSAVSTSVLPSSPQPSWGTSSSPLFFSLPFYPPHPPTATTRTRWGGERATPCAQTHGTLLFQVCCTISGLGGKIKQKNSRQTHTLTHTCAWPPAIPRCRFISLVSAPPHIRLDSVHWETKELLCFLSGPGYYLRAAKLDECGRCVWGCGQWCDRNPPHV